MDGLLTMGKRGRRPAYMTWSSDDLGRALSALRNGDMGLNAAARAYGVPKATLKRHHASTNKIANDDLKVAGRPPDLPQELEEELVEHALRMDQLLYGLSAMDLRKLAYQIAEQSGIPHRFSRQKQRAGKKWFWKFIKRHPEISLRRPEATSMQRANGFNQGAVNHFFDLYEAMTSTKLVFLLYRQKTEK